VSDFQIFAPGTTDEVFNNGNPNVVLHDINWNQTPTYTSQYLAKISGVYVLYFYCGGACTGSGPFNFAVTVQHGAVLFAPHAVRTGISGQLRVFVRTPTGTNITDPDLKVTLSGSWRASSYVPPSLHMLAVGSPVNGLVTLRFNVPRVLVHKHIVLIVNASGAAYSKIGRVVTYDTVL